MWTGQNSPSLCDLITAVSCILGHAIQTENYSSTTRLNQAKLQREKAYSNDFMEKGSCSKHINSTIGSLECPIPDESDAQAPAYLGGSQPAIPPISTYPHFAWLTRSASGDHSLHSESQSAQTGAQG